MEFTIEYWFRYGGGDEKDFDVDTVTAADYEKACDKIKKRVNSRKTRVTNFIDKTIY